MRKNPFHRDAFPDRHELNEHDPEWALALAAKAANPTTIVTPLGDATRWGSRGAVTIVTPNPTYVDQIISVATQDQYTRNWQIIGNVGASALAWLLAAADFTIGLEVTMGVGQGSIVQVFDVRALITQADPWYQQRFENFNRFRPFVISGGIIGRSINARFVFQVPALIPPANLPVICEASISPFAAGSGI